MSFNENIRKTQDYIKLPLLYNHWYVAGFAEEFNREPKARTLLERSMVFFRTEAGVLSALQNRCLHRSFPLSEGALEGDDIVCGYHGIKYNPEGEIVRVPSQKMCPNRKLRKYPVQELGPLVFIWMGEGEADMTALPKLPGVADPNYITVKDYVFLEGNYLFMQDNLNDLSHFAYLHRNSFGFDDSFLEVQPTVTETAEGIYCNRIEDRWEEVSKGLPPEYVERFAGKKVVRLDGGMTLSPGVFKGIAPTIVGEEGDEDYQVLSQYVNHYMTPETKTSCHYFWSISSDYHAPEMAELIKAGASQGFNEDKAAVAQMQSLMAVDKIDFQDMNLGADKAALLVRRKFLAWVNEEYGEEP